MKEEYQGREKGRKNIKNIYMKKERKEGRISRKRGTKKGRRVSRKEQCQGREKGWKEGRMEVRKEGYQ